MKRLFLTLLMCGMIVLVAVASQSIVRAQTTLSDGHVERIKQNCVAAQATLYQLHASDALLRVNRGKLYENISTKLMAPLNSRIALNRHEGLKLTATTLEYDRQVDVFRASYKAYEEAMSRLLDMNCADKPTEFYEVVQSMREKRQQVHDSTNSLTTLLTTYKTEFEDFARQFGGAS